MVTLLAGMPLPIRSIARTVPALAIAVVSTWKRIAVDMACDCTSSSAARSAWRLNNEKAYRKARSGNVKGIVPPEYVTRHGEN
ncbi:hypothetical protein GCM10027277_33220 [Pseudoduganella ginsengisoli]